MTSPRDHLRGRHRRYCARYGETFHARSAWEKHSRQVEILGVCTTKPEAEVRTSLTYMSDEKEVGISKHAIKWRGMYAILFPDHEIPDDSCKFRLFRHFSKVYQ